MKEIRIHGRGGQGNVKLAEIIAIAAFEDGKSPQAFPSFGVERRGAPVTAFVKIDNKFIRSREQVYHPDYLIIQDPSILGVENVFAGCKKNTVIIINSDKSPKALCPGVSYKVICMPANEISLKIIGKPITNTALLGAFAAYYKFSTKSLEKAIKINLGERLDKEIIDKNIKAMHEAYDWVKKNYKLD
ncbi:2-oxoacid:acceptor oxidoreductase family protein [Candidatus Falkowbacteria bacterium]|nr:2-oxoacid:acceptor oxidoreductase family protein [Candidatus Falkowbacteria bacterium]